MRRRRIVCTCHRAAASGADGRGDPTQGDARPERPPPKDRQRFNLMLSVPRTQMPSPNGCCGAHPETDSGSQHPPPVLGMALTALLGFASGTADATSFESLIERVNKLEAENR